MKLAIFDLDNTIIEGDSDHNWNTYIANLGFQDLDKHLAISEGFYQDYLNGRLIMDDYLAFNLKFFAEHPRAKTEKLLAEFAEKIIKPTFRPQAIKQIAEHRQMGHTLLIITATNELVTAPIAKLLGIENLIATEVEEINNKWTGKGKGIASFAQGKVTRLQQWLKPYKKEIADCYTYFYSDSFNDRFLLDIVNKPIAVTPDPKLKAHANKNGWEIKNWELE